jgi:hypothetical protein
MSSNSGGMFAVNKSFTRVLYNEKRPRRTSPGGVAFHSPKSQTITVPSSLVDTSCLLSGVLGQQIRLTFHLSNMPAFPHRLFFLRFWMVTPVITDKFRVCRGTIL